MEVINSNRIKKKIRYWLVPKGIEGVLRRTLSAVFLPHSLREIIKQNRQYKNRHIKERCFILATGPSIATQDISKLKDELCISVGSFYLHKDFQLIKPKYHVDAAHHAPYKFQEIEILFSEYEKYFKNEVTVFLGHTRYEFSYYNYLLKNQKEFEFEVRFIDYSSGFQLNEQNFNSKQVWDITGSLYSSRTVVYCAIQLAAYMGVKDIYLLGCDQDYLIRYLGGGFENNHCYSDKQAPISTVEAEGDVSLEGWFEEYYFRWKQYRLMQDYLNGRGGCIYNATEGGMLDVFPRVKLSDVV
jgi:hypothetical protein